MDAAKDLFHPAPLGLVKIHEASVDSLILGTIMTRPKIHFIPFLSANRNRNKEHDQKGCNFISSLAANQGRNEHQNCLGWLGGAATVLAILRATTSERSKSEDFADTRI